VPEPRSPPLQQPPRGPASAGTATGSACSSCAAPCLWPWRAAMSESKRGDATLLPARACGRRIFSQVHLRAAVLLLSLRVLARPGCAFAARERAKGQGTLRSRQRRTAAAGQGRTRPACCLRSSASRTPCSCIHAAPATAPALHSFAGAARLETSSASVERARLDAALQ